MSRSLMILVVCLLLTAACGGGGGTDPAAPPATPPLTGLTLGFTAMATGLVQPVAIVAAGDASDRIFLAEQRGTVRILAAGVLSATPFLDIRSRVLAGGEQGLLGLAFSPDYARNGRFYICYTRSPDGASVISRFTVSAEADLALASSEEVLLTVPQPFANHNGGQLAFGPDGFLYIGLGDGGSGGDPLDNAQNPAVLLGKLLRIDVDGVASGYAVPSDNPFVADPAWQPEIWAAGLRNPWRFSFDRATGDLFVADVGQETWEEVNFAPAGSGGGQNFEWNRREGEACYNPAVGCLSPPNATPPVAVYDHGQGCSVTGGYVFRGPGNPALQGVYLYGDFCSGAIWGLRPNGSGWDNQLLASSGVLISAFGEDEQGRLYLADYGSGRLLRIDQQ